MNKCTNTIAIPECQTAASIATEFEAAINTLKDLLQLAQRELADEGPCTISLLSAAERYALDLQEINKRLYSNARGS